MGSRSGIAVLQKLVAAAEPGTNNIGQYLAARASVLAPELAVPVATLEAAAYVTDEEIAPQLEALLRQRVEQSRSFRQVSAVERASTAASRIARSAVWEKSLVRIDPTLLLGDLLADTSNKYVAFSFDEHDITIDRAKLVDVSRVLTSKTYPDRSAYLDASGLHLRWKSGRGGLNLVTQIPGVLERDRVLHVVLERPAVAMPIVPVRRGGAWLGDILGEMGLLS